MVLPIGDAPNPRGTPIVTYLLIAVNVAVYVLITLPLGSTRPAIDDPMLETYLRVMTEELGGRLSIRELLAQVTSYDLLIFVHGFKPGAPAGSDLLASMFLHAGFMHLAGNMLFLWIYGDNVEHRLGRGRFLAWYLVTGVAATGFHALFSTRSLVPMIGASGAISGVLGFYFIWFPRNIVRLLWLFPPFMMDVIRVPARLVLGLYLIVENLLPFLVSSAGTGVAYGAHIGGFLAGLAAAWTIERRGFGVRRPRAAAARTAPPAGAVREAIAAGRFEDAATAYFALRPEATRRLLQASDALALAEWLGSNGQPEPALIVLRRFMRDFPRGPGLAEAHLLAGVILLRQLDQATSAYQHFLTALDLEPDPEVAELARRAIEEIEARQKRRIRPFKR